jgi:hypothetical protein
MGSRSNLTSGYYGFEPDILHQVIGSSEAIFHTLLEHYSVVKLVAISSTGVAELLHPNTPLQKASGNGIYGNKLCSLAGMSSVMRLMPSRLLPLLSLFNLSLDLKHVESHGI